MTDKIQTNFASNILESIREEPTDNQKNRPKPCRAFKSCHYIARSGDADSKKGFFCCGFWLKAKDEDIIRFCMSNADGVWERYRITPWEAQGIITVLAHANYFCMIFGDSETFDIAENMGNH